MLKNQPWLRRDQHDQGEDFWEMFSQRCHTDLEFQKQLSLYLLLAVEAEILSHQCHPCFEGMEGSWRIAKA